MKYFLKKWREPLNIVTYILLVAALVYFAIMPLYRSVQLKKNEIQEKITEQEFKSKKLQELPRIKQQYDFIQSKDGDVSVFLKREEAVILIEKLERLAEETDNKISITIPEVVKAKNSQKGKDDTALVDGLPSKEYLEMDIKLVGKYAQIIAFMHKLETSDYYSDILDIAIRKSSELAPSYQNSDQLFAVNPGAVPQGEVPDVNEGNKLEASLSVAFYLAK